MANRNKSIVYSSTQTNVNHETGVVTETTHNNVIRMPPEPAFVKLYIEDLGRLLDMPPGPTNLIYELARRMDYEGMITLNKAIKNRMAEHIGIKESSLRNYLTALVKADVVRIVDRGLYELNPHYFAKGDWSDIRKRRENFKLQVTYNAKGEREITGKLDDQADLFS